MMSEETLGAADIQEILRLLPHRYPFLLIDRVTDIRGEDHGIGIKNVTMNEPHFTGHFPDNPVMPGVLMVEGMAQTASILVLRLLPPPDYQSRARVLKWHRRPPFRPSRWPITTNFSLAGSTWTAGVKASGGSLTP